MVMYCLYDAPDIRLSELSHLVCESEVLRPSVRDHQSPVRQTAPRVNETVRRNQLPPEMIDWEGIEHRQAVSFCHDYSMKISSFISSHSLSRVLLAVYSRSKCNLKATEEIINKRE